MSRDQRICPRCRYVNPPNANICGWCGESLDYEAVKSSFRLYDPSKRRKSLAQRRMEKFMNDPNSMPELDKAMFNLRKKLIDAVARQNDEKPAKIEHGGNGHAYPSVPPPVPSEVQKPPQQQFPQAAQWSRETTEGKGINDKGGKLENSDKLGENPIKEERPSIGEIKASISNLQLSNLTTEMNRASGMEKLSLLVELFYLVDLVHSNVEKGNYEKALAYLENYENTLASLGKMNLPQASKVRECLDYKTVPVSCTRDEILQKVDLLRVELMDLLREKLS